MAPFSLLLFFYLLPFSIATCNDHPLPRPLVIELPSQDQSVSPSDTNMQCTSWRFAVEANNVSPWQTIPAECAEYVKEYVTGKGYVSDLEMVAKESLEYARSVVGDVGDGEAVWVFDIDETLLSNLPYYAVHGFGLEIFDANKFNNWVDEATAPAIPSSLKLYEEVLGLGFKVILMTGRSEEQRTATVNNLRKAGYHDWERLILRGVNDRKKHAAMYKSEKRSEMVADGYIILGNSGDQWSDLLGYSMSTRSFKLPNPMYHIA